MDSSYWSRLRLLTPHLLLVAAKKQAKPHSFRLIPRGKRLATKSAVLPPHEFGRHDLSVAFSFPHGAPLRILVRVGVGAGRAGPRDRPGAGQGTGVRPARVRVVRPALHTDAAAVRLAQVAGPRRPATTRRVGRSRPPVPTRITGSRTGPWVLASACRRGRQGPWVHPPAVATTVPPVSIDSPRPFPLAPSPAITTPRVRVCPDVARGNLP